MCDRIFAVEGSVTRIQGVQGSLFEHNERRQLGDGAFIEIRAGWVSAATPGEEELLDALLSTVPWRAERRQMYDRVVDVPRLVSFHDLTVDDPRTPS
jgi:alkylated DNA repair dioxygenase AlkB